MNTNAACIDVTGSKKAMDIAYLEGNEICFHSVSTIEQFRDWIQDFDFRIIAVDAPSKENNGSVSEHRHDFEIPADRYENFRICEAVLRLKGIGLYNTPCNNPPEWMKKGWGLYEMMDNAGYTLWDKPGEVFLKANKKYAIEVHPHASFVVGLGWIPQKKQSLAGQLERVAYLRHEIDELGIDPDDTLLSHDHLENLREKITDSDWDSILEKGMSLPGLSHDRLDAAVGLTTAIRFARGEAYAVGHKRDGVIVVPGKLETEDKYKAKGGTA